MSLIIIVISLALEFVVGRWQHLRKLVWVTHYREALFRRLPAEWTEDWRGLTIILLPIVLLMLLLQYAVGGEVFGFWQLLLGVAVLTYCLGPEPLNELVNEYLQACEQKETTRAREVAAKILSGPLPGSIHQLSMEVTRAIFYEANKRVFAILLWFLLLGPVGALLYRIVAFLTESDDELNSQDSMRAAANLVYAIMDWLPAHLLALTFFLAGSFDDALEGWRKYRYSSIQGDERNRAMVTGIGCASMRHEVDDAVLQEDQEGEYDLRWLRTARLLLIRSLVIWLAAIALLTFAGVFI